MTTLNMKDSLAGVAEAASNGKQTVIFTAKNQACFMTRVDKFDMSTINPNLSGTHPAFIVDGVEKPYILIGTYQAVLRNGEVLSVPNENPTSNTTRQTLATAAFASGDGFHLMTAAEWAAVLLKCQGANTYPTCNTFQGTSSQLAAQGISSIGRRVDGAVAGTDGLGITYTGSGDVNWRANLAYNGISDMVGNVNEITQGVRLVNGEIQVIPDNNASSSKYSTSISSSDWRAIDATNGGYVQPDGNGTTANTVKYFQSGAVDYSIIATTGTPTNNMIVAPSTNVVQPAALNKLKSLGLFPIITNIESGYMFTNSVGTQYMSRGGHFLTQNQAGISHLSLADPIDVTDITLGARICYVPQ